MHLHKQNKAVSDKVVRSHKAGKLLLVEVLIREKGGVCFVPTKKQAPVHVCRDHYCHLAQMICAQGDAEKDNGVVR